MIPGTWNAQIVSELKPDPAFDIVISKGHFSGFLGTCLQAELDRYGITTLAVCGVTTSVCVETTVRDAAQIGYHCLVAADAVAEFDPDMHDATLKALQYAFADVTVVDTMTNAWRIAAQHMPASPAV